MKRSAAIVLAMVFFLSACTSILPSQQQPNEAPGVDAQATDQALAATMVMETLNALPTPTTEPATNTPEPTATHTEVVASSTETAIETLTPDPNATDNPTGTLETATESAPVTVTGTLPTATQVQPGTPTPTETLYARFYGTLPPSVPFGKVRLINKSKAEVYISMHCTTADGYTTIIEYPVEKRLRVSAPAGSYTYVAWVGGRQFLGWFNLNRNGDIEITFEKNEVTIK